MNFLEENFKKMLNEPLVFDSFILEHYFNKLPNDTFRWEFIKDNKDNDKFLVNLGIDETYLTIEGEKGKGYFKNSIGISHGVCVLLELLELDYTLIIPK